MSYQKSKRVATLVAILVFGWTTTANPLGVWVKEALDLSPYKPDFSLVKTGIFSTSGDLKELFSQEKLKSLCQREHTLEAWVTHRLSPQEILSEAAARKLGKALKKQFEGTCIQNVELDVEPLKEIPHWYEKFLVHVKQSAELLRIRPALYLPQPLERVLASADGVDLMLYDTGLAQDAYVAFLLETFQAVEKVSTAIPGKRIRLGLPAYYDKTKRHNLAAENLKSVIFALSKYTPFSKEPWCKGSIEFALYAGWTLTKEDKALTQVIRAWKDSVCSKP